MNRNTQALSDFNQQIELRLTMHNAIKYAVTLNSRHSAVAGVIFMLIILSGCASNPPEVTPVKTTAQPRIVEYALSLQGAPYRYGKDSPEEGFDCSGFVRHVYQKQGILLPRTTKAMAESLPQILNSAVHSGDLLFFNTNGKPFSHVGIYLNGDKFIHAPSRRSGKVMVSSLKNKYWQRCYIGARRP
ncbi:MAG: C40 family peptidase [Methylococcaceae bacterium]